MIPDGWLDGGGAGKEQRRKGASGYDEVWLLWCGGVVVVHMVMRHGRASMMYRSWQVCVSSMMGGCSLDAGVRSREEGAREDYQCSVR